MEGKIIHEDSDKNYSSHGEAGSLETSLADEHVSENMESWDVLSQATCFLSKTGMRISKQQQKRRGSLCQLPYKRATVALDFVQGLIRL